MTATGISADLSVQTLRAAITVLTKLDRRWRKGGRKRPLYRYLATVFNFYVVLKRTDDSRTVAKRMAELAGLNHQPDCHPIRTIIDATSTADRKSKSRWTQALRFAWRERSKYKNLPECLRANGGIAGCAEKWADAQAAMRTPPGYVRVGGEHRVPKIPLFVGVEMIDQYGNLLSCHSRCWSPLSMVLSLGRDGMGRVLRFSRPPGVNLY